MTYLEFKNKHNGEYIDVDNEYGAQCYDLAQKYITECLGLPNTIIAGAGYVGNLLKEPHISRIKQYFDEVPLNQKQPGDIEIWDTHHIAIMDHWDPSIGLNFYFSQNVGTGANPKGPSQVIAIPDTPNCKAFRVKGSKQTLNDIIKIKVSEVNKIMNEILDLVK